MRGFCRVRKFPGAGALHAYFNRTGSFIFSRGGNIAIDLSLLVWLLPNRRNASARQALPRASQNNKQCCGWAVREGAASKQATHDGAQYTQTQTLWAASSAKHGMKRIGGAKRESKSMGVLLDPERQYTQTQTLWAVSSAEHGKKRIKGTKRESKNMSVLLDPMGGRQERLAMYGADSAGDNK